MKEDSDQRQNRRHEETFHAGAFWTAMAAVFG
jgi:hypothetical protein